MTSTSEPKSKVITLSDLTRAGLYYVVYSMEDSGNDLAGALASLQAAIDRTPDDLDHYVRDFRPYAYRQSVNHVDTAASRSAASTNRAKVVTAYAARYGDWHNADRTDLP